MKILQTRLAIAFSVVGACVSGVASADEAKIQLRVKVGDAIESLLTVVDGHQAELKSASLDLAVTPTLSQEGVLLSLTLSDADKKIIGSPRLKGQFGQQMKLVLRPESSSALVILLTPERIN